MGIIIITYIFAPCFAEAGALSIVQCIFNTICGTAHTDNTHSNTPKASVFGETTKRQRIPKPQEIKRHTSRKKKVADSRCRKKHFKKIKIATENPDNPVTKELTDKKRVRTDDSEETVFSKSSNDSIITNENRVCE